MNGLLHKQLFMVILIAAAALLVIVGVWGLALFDSETTPPSPVTTTTDTVPAETTTAPPETTTTAEPPVETTTKKEEPPVTPSEKKYIALTFDDGPSMSITPQILDLLEEYDAKATFFVNGYNVTEGKARFLKRAIALGCEIGNHTESHAKLTTLSPEEIVKEVTAVNEKLYELCGYETTLLRPPGGNTNHYVMQSMYDAGLRMHSIQWNNDSRDWEFQEKYRDGLLTKEAAVALTHEEIHKWSLDGSILLMHDIWEITPDVLRVVLEDLTAQGYTFVTVSEMFEFEEMGEDAYFSMFYADDVIRTLK